MAFCKNCGAELEEGTAFCPKCGADQQQEKRAAQQTQQTPPSGADWVQQNAAQSQTPVTNDSGSIGWGLLGFCVPIVGLVLFLVWRNEKPRAAKVAGVGALIAVIISVIWYVLVLVAGVGAMFLF